MDLGARLGIKLSNFAADAGAKPSRKFGQALGSTSNQPTSTKTRYSMVQYGTVWYSMVQYPQIGWLALESQNSREFLVGFVLLFFPTMHCDHPQYVIVS